MKKSVYDIVTEKIISGLEKGQIPWKRKWIGGGLPKNFFSDRNYRGINQLLLALNSFDSPYYLTFKQAKKLGGRVKKGSQSEMVVFWKVYKNSCTVENEDTGDIEIKTDPRFVLRYYNVFNAEQIGGVDFPEPETFDHNPIEKAEKIWNGYNGKPKVTKGAPAYNFVQDIIKMPNREQFETAEDYYKTLFHEGIHSTGHESRLNRSMKGMLNKQSYSFEELIAEIGASYLVNQTGIDWDETNSQAYINGWLRFLKEQNSGTILSAATKAKKATQFILGEVDQEKQAEAA